MRAVKRLKRARAARTSLNLKIYHCGPSKSVDNVNYVYIVLLSSGTGTFGRVILVRDVPTNKYYALKVMNITEVIKLRQVQHVNSEKEILASISHPFIVNL